MSLTKKQRERLAEIAKSDLKQANSYYEATVQPLLRERYDIYRADKEYYKKKFPVLSEQVDLVSYDLWSTVEECLPTLMAAFFGNSRVCSIIGMGDEDVERARKFQKLIDWQIMKLNKGFLTIQQWFREALSVEMGIVKCWWNRELEWEEITEFLNADALALLMADPRVEIKAVSPEPDTFGDYTVRYETANVLQNRPVIELVKADDFRWSPYARSIEEANFVGQRRYVTGDYLKRKANQGVYDAKAVEKALAVETTAQYSDIARDRNKGFEERDTSGDKARALHEIWECYVKVDADGDGLLEERIVTLCNDVMLRECVNKFGRAPFFHLTANHDPYTVMPTLGFGEVVGELQAIKTALIRQVVVNMALNNNPRTFINETAMNVNDLMKNRQYIRVRGNPQQLVYNQPIQPVAAWTMPFLEYIETQKEQWVGRTRYNQGLDARSLNHTATGISLIMQASMRRLGHIVRVFAETGVGELYRFLIKLNQMYMDQEQVVRLMNENITITPDDIDGHFDLDVSAETGITDRQQEIQNLQNYLAILFPQGAQLGAVGAEQWRTTVRRLMEVMEVKNPDEILGNGGGMGFGPGGASGIHGAPSKTGGAGDPGNILSGLPPEIAGRLGGGNAELPFTGTSR